MIFQNLISCCNIDLFGQEGLGKLCLINKSAAKGYFFFSLSLFFKTLTRNSLAVWGLGLDAFATVAWVQSLVRELDPVSQVALPKGKKTKTKLLTEQQVHNIYRKLAFRKLFSHCFLDFLVSGRFFPAPSFVFLL